VPESLTQFRACRQMPGCHRCYHGDANLALHNNLMFRHGLRVSEACGLKFDQVDTDSRVLHVRRLKRGLSTTQPLRSDELRAIAAWLKQRARMKPAGKSFFVSEQRKPLHRSTVNAALKKHSELAALPLAPTPTCCAMPAALLSPTRAPTPGSFRTISGIATFSTPSATPLPIRRDLRGCGGKSLAWSFRLRNLRARPKSGRFRRIDRAPPAMRASCASGDSRRRAQWPRCE
jgi:integrase-like protein